MIIVKLLLAGAISTLAQRSPEQIAIGLITCMGFLLLISRYAPYKENGHDVMSFLVYLSLTMTLLIGSLKSTHDALSIDNDIEWLGLNQDQLGGILMAINCTPLMCLIVFVVLWTVNRKRTRRSDVSGTHVVPVMAVTVHGLTATRTKPCQDGQDVALRSWGLEK